MGLDWIIGVEKYALGVETERGVRGCSYRRVMDVVGYGVYKIVIHKGKFHSHPTPPPLGSK